MDWTSHAKALAETLVVPINWSRQKYPILSSLKGEESCQRQASSGLSHSRAKKSTPSTNIGKSSFGPSPFPSLDTYVLSNTTGSRGGVPGEIRGWSLFYNDENNNTNDSNDVLVPCGIEYQLSRNRFCEHVGRQHKSNGIMWKFDLESFYCFQKCWDPDCRAYGFHHGQFIEFPDDVKAAVTEELFELALMQLDLSGVETNERQPAKA
jgi:hypothetical protein